MAFDEKNKGDKNDIDSSSGDVNENDPSKSFLNKIDVDFYKSDDNSDFAPENSPKADDHPDGKTESPKAPAESAQKPEYEDIDSGKDMFWTAQRKRKAKIIGFSILGVVAVLIAIAVFIVFFYLGKINTPGKSKESTEEIAQDIPDDGRMYQEPSASQISSLEDMIKQNYDRGTAISNKNILNILLIGLDKEESAKRRGLSDSMILISINKKDKNIKMVSFFRDSYCYIPVNGGYYGKMNAAHSLSGPQMVIQTIERTYKINIDNYVSVNFTSFSKVIDALGGVDVEVTKSEADFMRRTTHINVQPGKVHFNGTDALVYSRIRHGDSDINRTERQRKVLLSLEEKAKTASLFRVNNALNQLLPYVETGLTKGQILSLAAAAVTDNYTSYPITQITMPDQKTVTTFSRTSDFLSSANKLDSMTGIGMIFNLKSAGNGQWAWAVDYPLSARNLQLAIYGRTNIVLSQDRATLAQLLAKKIGGYSGSSVSSYSRSGTSSYKPVSTKRYYSYSTTETTSEKEYTTKKETTTEKRSTTEEKKTTEAPTKSAKKD